MNHNIVERASDVSSFCYQFLVYAVLAGTAIALISEVIFELPM